MNVRKREGNMRKVVIIIFCILGMIVGVAVSGAVQDVSFLNWLSIGGEIGIKTPIVIDLYFVQFTIAFWLKVTVGGVIGMIGFGVLAKALTKWLKL